MMSIDAVQNARHGARQTSYSVCFAQTFNEIAVTKKQGWQGDAIKD
jgi:hypothetical protein